MTDKDLTAPEAVERLAERLDDAQCTSGCGTMKFCMCAYAADSVDTLRALSAALEAERARAEAAEARERALLQSNDQDRKALVENTSLRRRLKAEEAKLREAVDAATGLADWIEHEAGCELPFDARALRAPLDNPNK